MNDFDEMPGSRRFRFLVERERADMAWLVHAVASMYDEVSGGRISKPMTYPEHVIDAFNERIQREAKEAVDEERDRIRTEVESLPGLDWQYEPGGTTQPMRNMVDRQAVLELLKSETEPDNDDWDPATSRRAWKNGEENGSDSGPLTGRLV